MQVLNEELLWSFKKTHADARSQIDSWKNEVDKAQWNTPHDLKNRYPKASILKNQNIVFNICRNKYRLWVKINYKNQIILIKKIGTHKEYNKWQII